MRRHVDPQLVGGLTILGLIGLAALALPLIVDVSLAEIGALPPRRPPSSEHWLGTDGQGRDILTALALALPQTLKIGIGAGFVSLSLGVALGLAAGFAGGWLDAVVRTACDVMMTICPRFAALSAARTSTIDSATCTLSDGGEITVATRQEEFENRFASTPTV